MENFHCAIKVRLANDNLFFGPGVVELLNLTKELESLNAAAKHMNLSYSKANKMIKQAEESLGFKLLDRKIGGSNGGGSSLTLECIEFLKKYISFEEKIKLYSEKLFKESFIEYIKNPDTN